MLGIGVFTGVDYGVARACMLGIGVDYGVARAYMLGIGVFTGVDYGAARGCMLGIGVFTGVDYGVARACMLGIGVFTGVDFKWLTPNALMSFGSSSSKYCAEVVRFSFVNSKSAGEEKPKFMPISNEPRDATSAHIATTLTRPLPHDSVGPLGVGDERLSSGKFSSVL